MPNELQLSILGEFTIIRTAGNNYCVDRHGGGVNDVLRIIGRVTSNAPLDPGISPYWSGQFVQDADISY